ncbi:MAG: hypothetical protein HOO99_01085 [Hyphomicrobiaceae bacterium]|nr:hypothetical protein [Hyphomicrobiaceae bacterium]
MLHWSIPLIAVPVIVVLLARSDFVRSVVVAIAQAGYRSLNCICARLAGGLDAVLRPSSFNGEVANSRMSLWVFLNGSAVIAIEHISQRSPDQALAWACLLLTLHSGIVLASILKFAEENRRMRQGTPRGGLYFGELAAVRNVWVMILEALIVITVGAVALKLAAVLYPLAILSKVPDTGTETLDYLLCLLSQLPIYGQLLQTTDFGSEIEFGGVFGAYVAKAIELTGKSILGGAILAWALQRLAISSIMNQLKTAESEDAHFLQVLVTQAPVQIKVLLLTLAFDNSQPLGQVRAINTMRHRKVWTFPSTFLDRLLEIDRKVRVAGLSQILLFLEDDGMVFDIDYLIAIHERALRTYSVVRPTVSDPIEDAVLSRLGAIVALTTALLVKRQHAITVSKKQYRAMVEIAAAHKDEAVRRLMAGFLAAANARR